MHYVLEVMLQVKMMIQKFLALENNNDYIVFTTF